MKISTLSAKKEARKAAAIEKQKKAAYFRLVEAANNAEIIGSVVYVRATSSTVSDVSANIIASLLPDAAKGLDVHIVFDDRRGLIKLANETVWRAVG